jgi:tetratricopeptide (TPR) repeat protein
MQAAIFNRGNVLQKMNCINQALWCYEQALTLQPNFPEAEMAQSHCLLLQRRLRRRLAASRSALADVTAARPGPFSA